MNTKKKIGFILLGVVILCWIAVPVLPFFRFPHKALIITTLLIGGEILFVITIALLGKEYWKKIKQWFRRLFSSEKQPDIFTNSDSQTLRDETILFREKGWNEKNQSEEE